MRFCGTIDVCAQRRSQIPNSVHHHRKLHDNVFFKTPELVIANTIKVRLFLARVCIYVQIHIRALISLLTYPVDTHQWSTVVCRVPLAAVQIAGLVLLCKYESPYAYVYMIYISVAFVKSSCLAAHFDQLGQGPLTHGFSSVAVALFGFAGAAPRRSILCCCEVGVSWTARRIGPQPC